MYYLSRDESNVKFNPKVHTLEKLYELMDDLYFEYACAYVIYYNLLLNLKEQRKLDENQLENLKASLEKYTNEKDEVVSRKHNITPLLLE